MGNFETKSGPDHLDVDNDFLWTVSGGPGKARGQVKAPQRSEGGQT